mmetsp:Transcript_92337/g.169675  ORF Transcript_92337/g.169675 Transcript_92337/m.169675 type:complete len:283 (+) Transcript_92337:86-934(+)
MHRAIPVGNKACAERVRARNQELHKQRLRAMKPLVDTSEPSVVHLDHLRNNLKREQLIEDRYYEIDRENKILLQKMSDIMKNTSYPTDRAKSGPPSLNRDLRKMQLMRITQENQAILKRIQRAQPIYNHVEWEDAYRRSATYLRNKCEYPPPLASRKTTSRGLNLAPLSGKSGSGGFEDARASSARSVPAGMGSGLDNEELRHVLKEGKKIGSIYYLIEMATDGRTLMISAYDGDTQRTLELLVSEKNHRRLQRECNGDYGLLAERLRIDGDRLVLEGSPDE